MRLSFSRPRVQRDLQSLSSSRTGLKRIGLTCKASSESRSDPAQRLEGNESATRLSTETRPNSDQLQYFGDSPAAREHRHTDSVQSIPFRPQPSLAAKLGNNIKAGACALLGITFFIAVIRTVRKAANPQVKKRSQMVKNKLIVESLDEYLPTRRQELTSGVIGGLRRKTGFKPTEIFRKYLWYALRERKFNQEVVDDLVYLKQILSLSDEQTAEAIKERAQQVYQKFGTIMLNTAGMTEGGIERKATARALFSKLQYLTNYDELLAPGSQAAESTNMREIFGATEDDADRLRIVSLQEVDLDKLEGQFDKDA